MDLVEVLRQSERDIFDYFAEEVFADEAEDVQALLLKLSLLDNIELDTCAGLFTWTNCARVLPTLVRRNVFITVASDEKGEAYRLHPLFQSFLRRRLRSEIGRSGVSAEHRRFAGHFLAQGAWEQGVRHLLAAEDFNAAAEVIAAVKLDQRAIGTGKAGDITNRIIARFRELTQSTGTPIYA